MFYRFVEFGPSISTEKTYFYNRPSLMCVRCEDEVAAAQAGGGITSHPTQRRGFRPFEGTANRLRDN